MVLPSILTPADRTLARAARPTPEYIYDDSQLPCIPPDRPDLHELNHCVEALTIIFPDVQLEVFREILSKFDGESRFELVTDHLLRNGAEWVKGRWRKQPKEGEPPLPEYSRLDGFRSLEYKGAVRALAWEEFKGLSRSMIEAVLAEHNYYYLDARETLADVSTRSWRFTFTGLFYRRKAVDMKRAIDHPLISWRSFGNGAIVPTIRATGSAELDRELYNVLVRPLKTKEDKLQNERDHLVAAAINTEDAEELGAIYDCECCFSSGPFEEFTHCNQREHMICFRCVQFSIKEALFGQGWGRTIDNEKGTLRCPAVDGDGCPGHITADHLHRAMANEPSGPEMLLKMEQRLAHNSLVAAEVPVVHCPFCEYAEIDDIYMPPGDTKLKMRPETPWTFALYSTFTLSTTLNVPAAMGLFLITALLYFLLCWRGISRDYRMAKLDFFRKCRGLRFECQNPECKRMSCLSCQKTWTDVHICHESSLIALRTQIEQAMSMAVKRVCPACNTSFVKNSGCNKLTCPCGYRMCYVCRANIGSTGYRHFCEHFRPHGDGRRCSECDRCNLWESEDTDRILRDAKKEAEDKWKGTEKRELSHNDETFLKTGHASNMEQVTLWMLLRRERFRPSRRQLIELFIETLYM